MSTGVSYSSASRTAAFATVSGTWTAAVGKLANLRQPRDRASTSNAGALTFTFPVVSPIQFVGIIDHSFGTGVTCRVQLFNAASSQIYDSGTVSFWPTGGPVAGFPSVRPFVLNSEVQAKSGRVDFSAAGAIGGIEAARFWDWGGVSPKQEWGFSPNNPVIPLAGGGGETQPGWMPRIFNGQLDYIAMGIAATTGVDFQRAQGRSRPFVYVEDSADATSWPRRCALMTNDELPPTVGALYRHDTFQFRFKELSK